MASPGSAVAAPRRRDIQALRGLAVAAVVAFHAAPSLAPNGYLGVDAFFVISGFVVTPLLLRLRHRHDLAEFYARRIRRLTPALGVLLAGAAILSLFLASVGTIQSDTAKLGLTAVVLGANVGASILAGDYFKSAPNPLLHTWSLSVEEQIYLLLPLAILGAAIALRGSMPRAASVVLVAVLVVSAAVTLSPLVGEPFRFYSLTSRAWEFALGGIAVMFASRWTTSSPRIQQAAVLLLVVSLLLPIVLAWPFPWPEALTAFIAAAAMIAGTGRQSESRWLSPAVWCGDRSYSIYLWHMPLIVILRDSPVIGTTRSAWVVAAATVASFMVGDLSYRLVEQRFRDRPGRPDARPVPLLRIAFWFAVVPALMLGALGFAARNHFWKADSLALVETPGWRVDPSCDRLANTEPCRTETPRARGVAFLVGDSHAGAISQAFVDAATAADLNAHTWLWPFCPLWDLSSLMPHDRDAIRTALGAECLARNERVFAHLRHLRPDVIVTTSRSSADYGHYLGARGRDLFHEATAATFTSLKGITRKLIVVGPVPEFPTVNFGFGVLQRPRFTPIERQLIAPEPFEDDMKFRAMSAAAGAAFISGIEPYCNATACDYRQFLDYHHVSPSGADRLKPLLAAALSPR